MVGDSDLSPLIAIDVFQLYPWHFKQYVCKHKVFLDLASCHLVWETSLIAIRCQSMGSRRKLCVLDPGMCFSFCLNINIYSCIHLFPLEKKSGNLFHVGENWIDQGQDPPRIQAWCCVQKSPRGKHLDLVPRTRGIEGGQYPSAPRLAFQVLSPRPCIADPIHVTLLVSMLLVDWHGN